MIFTVGDTHGMPVDTYKILKSKWSEYTSLTKNDTVIQLGDFGWVWYPFGTNKEQEHWLDFLATRKYTLVVVLGNHENYDIIETLPLEIRYGAPVRVLKRKSNKFGEGEIVFLERGYVYTIEEMKFFAFGGAQSKDSSSRIMGKDWWKQEIPSYQEFERGFVSLDENHWKVDYVITHTCPRIVMGDFINCAGDDVIKFKDPVAMYFDEIYKKLSFKEWRFGHLHTDVVNDYSSTGDGIFVCQYKGNPKIVLP